MLRAVHPQTCPERSRRIPQKDAPRRTQRTRELAKENSLRSLRSLRFIPSRHSSLGTCHRDAGTRRFNSSNQFSTTLICVRASACSVGLIIKKRPSGATS